MGGEYIPADNKAPLTLQGHTVTVYGATGFLGRYVVNRLGSWLATSKLESFTYQDSSKRMYGRCSVSR
jgi:hypothetical protein